MSIFGRSKAGRNLVNFILAIHHQKSHIVETSPNQTEVTVREEAPLTDTTSQGTGTSACGTDTFRYSAGSSACEKGEAKLETNTPEHIIISLVGTFLRS